MPSTVFHRRDHREWALLGLLALSWALLVAPVLHREAHAHGDHGHRHGPTAPLKHGEGSLEHQLLAWVDAPAVVMPSGVWVPVVRKVERVPGAPDVGQRFSVARPQGP